MPRIRPFCVVTMSLAVAGFSMGCGPSHPNGTAGSAASATSSALVAPSSSSPMMAGRLTYQQLDDVYQQELFDMKKMKDPYEKKVSAVTTRLGKPSTADATATVWYGVRPKDESLPESCYELRIEKSGASAIQTVDDAKCQPHPPGPSP